MTYGICNLSAIAMRKEARHTSEMVNQLLYNETYIVLDKTKEWVLVRMANSEDRFYEGWIQAKQFCEIGEKDFNDLKSKTTYLINKPIAIVEGKMLTLGTPLYEPHPDAVEIPGVFHPELMVEYAQMLLGAPYLWGGRTSMGIDCSGLVQICACLSGYVLPRDANQQVGYGELVYFLQETQPGDLAFFGDEDGHITHVGIIIDGEQIIHASGQVRIDYLDQSGIFNKEKNEHTHRLQVVKRL